MNHHKLSLNEALARLRDAEDALDAIRCGEVDALVNHGSQDQPHLYSLESADRPYRRLIEQMQEGAMMLSLTGIVLYSNQRMAEILGLEATPLTGRAFVECLPPDDRKRFRVFFEGCGEAPCRGEFTVQSAHAPARPVVISISHVTDERPSDGTSSEPIVCAVVSDLTERREIEAQLRHAQKMEAVGQLTGGLAHDFNNLLQSIHGNLELIQLLPAKPEKVRQWAHNASRSVQRGAKLTAQLLAFSRSQQIELCVLSIPSLLQGMGELIERTIGSSVRVRVDVDSALPSAVADPTQLELAVLNLAINGRDAMPEGGDLVISAGMVDIEGDNEVVDGRYLELRVSDTGTGMSEETRNKAFDPFFTTKGVGAGTGLGLAQVYGIARQAGGTARIASQPGEGTTVSIFLRCSKDAPDEVFTKRAAQPAYSLTIKQVLVVDDDADIRTLLSESLDFLGFKPVLAADGQSALALLEHESFEVILLDFAMPNMTGGQLAERIRMIHPEVPIVFVSGFADGLDISTISGPAPAILHKPFSMDQLSTTLARMVVKK